MEIQKNYRKELLIYRGAIQAAARKPRHNPSCTRFVITHGVKINHIASFLGIKPIESIRDLRKNDIIFVVDETLQKFKCVVWMIIPETRQDFVGNCYKIYLVKQEPGCFNDHANVSFRIPEQYRRFMIPCSQLEYPYHTNICCFTDDTGAIIETKTETQTFILMK